MSPGDSFEEMKANSSAKGFTFPYLLDETQEVAKTYGATRTPHVYVLQKESGRYRVQYIGAVDNNYQNPADVTEAYVENAVDALLNKKPVPKVNTKAIGCTIKWS